MDVPTLIREIKALPPEDRRELDRRLDADDAGELPGEPWEVVRKRLGWDRPARNG